MELTGNQSQGDQKDKKLISQDLATVRDIGKAFDSAKDETVVKIV